jgi:hypothetical protein
LIARVVGVAAFAALLVTPGPAAAAAAAARTVAAGAPFPLVVTGFAPRAIVDVRLLGSPVVTSRRADGAGVVRTTYRAPASDGRYRLVVTGRPDVRPPSRSGSPAGLTVVALVPRVVFVELRVVHPHPSGEGTQGIGTDRPGVANTGLDVATQLGWAAVPLLSGAVLLVIGRRRGARDAR